MTDYMDLFYQYIMTSVQVLFGFHFFIRLLHKKVKFYYYLIFEIYAVLAIHFFSGGTIAELGIFVLLLTAFGIVAFAAQKTESVFQRAEIFGQSFLCSVLIVEIMQLSYGIVKPLLSILYPHLSAFDGKTVGIVFMVAGEVVALLLTALNFSIVKRFFFGEMYSFHYGEIKRQYMLLVLIPVLTIFIMDEYIDSVIYDEVVTDIGRADNYPYINHYQMLAMQFLGMASLFCNLFAYKKLLKTFCLGAELSLLEQKEHSLKQYVEEAKFHYEKTKSFRHDIRNHIVVVKELLKEQKIEEALHYIGDMKTMAEELSFPCSTNNPVADILVGNKLGVAKDMGIHIKCSLVLPCPCGLRDIDVGIILSNALDNATCACKNMDAGAEKFIHVSGRIQGDFLMLEVENSYQGTGMFRKGTGLSNIKSVAEKYDGTMSIKTQGNVFTLHVLLIIPQNSEM